MNNITTSWMQVTSGQGPDECCWVVARIVEKVLAEAVANDIKAYVLETVAGSKCDLFKSALIAIEGAGISEFVKGWEGTVQWIGKSMFRDRHKRKNWFVGVTSYQVPESIVINSNEIKFDRMRSSGPGGQHVNKTESAIRATHIATGISAIAQEERSQHLNRKLALGRLYEKLNHEKKVTEQSQQKQRWGDHASLERGNPIRVFEGIDFRHRKKVR